MTKKIADRSAWIDAGMALLDRGVVPAAVGYTTIGAEIGAGVGKGSFTHHWGQVDALHLAVIDRFLADVSEAWAVVAPREGVVWDPLAELLQMRAPAVRYATRIDTMIRWAQTPEASRPATGGRNCECWDRAKAVTDEFTSRIHARVRRLLEDLLPEDEVDAEADVIAPEVGAGRPRWPDSDDRFRAHLQTLSRSADALTPVEMDLPDTGMALILVGSDGRQALAEEDRAEVAAAVRMIARRMQRRGERDEPIAANGARLA